MIFDHKSGRSSAVAVSVERRTCCHGELSGDGSIQINPNQRLDVQVVELGCGFDDGVGSDGKTAVVVPSLQPNQPGCSHELVEAGMVGLVIGDSPVGLVNEVVILVVVEVAVGSLQPNHPG